MKKQNEQKNKNCGKNKAEKAENDKFQHGGNND